MAFTEEIGQITSLLVTMGLNEYQASALSHLLLLGETKAAEVSKASGVPPARIYDVLDDLAKMGLVTKKPGRPSLYAPRSPQDMVNLLIAIQRENLQKKLAFLESKAKTLVDIANKVYLKGEKGTESVPLFRIVSVGDVSLEETKSMYDAATQEILILSRAMEYFPQVSENLKTAKTRGVNIRIILMNPNLMGQEDKEKQEKILHILRKTLGKKLMLRFSDNVPIRGSITDPENNGRAIFLVEDPGVPFFFREAAVTSHKSVVKGLALMFNLLWEHKSKKLD